MVRENRRAERADIRMSVSVLLLDHGTGTTLAGPVEGEATNFSPMGIALSLSSIMINGHHLFFTCQDNPSHIMSIGFTLPDKPKTVLNVPAKPVWYDRDFESDEKRILLGVKFLLGRKDEVIKKLTKGLFDHKGAPASWWKIFT